jgi:hypothetical protein
MRNRAFVGLALLVLVSGIAMAGALSGRSQEAAQEQPVSWDNWRAAQAKAKECDDAGKYAEALQYYLEYARQAEGLGRKDLAAWGKNNAAFMIIKMHKADPAVDLAPAEKLLEEGLAIAEATEDCKRLLASNMEYVKLYKK